jgi:hypothetical protein
MIPLHDPTKIKNKLIKTIIIMSVGFILSIIVTKGNNKALFKEFIKIVIMKVKI